MTNLEDWVHGIESWGFRVVDYDDDTMFFEGIERDDDTMITYRIAPGVFVDYINIKSRYRSENAAHSGRRGYRIAYCSSGNYYTHINGSKVLITSAEVFVGKAIPEAKASYGTQEGIVAFNIVVAPDEIEGRTFLADLSRDFVDAVKEVKDMGFTVKRKDALDEARGLIDALAKADRAGIGLMAFRLLSTISKEQVSANRKRYFQETEDEFVAEIEQYLRENLRESVTLDRLEEVFGCSKSTIINKFIRTCQYTPMKYLANLRMMEAERQLIDTNASMTYIAESVGYDNPSNFSRAFKQFTGLSPSAYRKCFGQSKNDTKKAKPTSRVIP